MQITFVFLLDKTYNVKRFNLFILKSYVGPFILTFFIAMFVMLMQFLWKWVDDMVGKGFDYDVIAELLFYASATFVPMALPLAVLLSSLMTFGNLGEKYELIAIKSAGVSLQKVMKPLIILMLFLIVAAFYFSNNIMPKANLKFYTLLKDVRSQKPAVQIDKGVFYTEIDDIVIKIGDKGEDGTSIKDVIIYNHADGRGNTNVTYAKSGKMEITKDKMNLVFTLYDGYSYNENVNTVQGNKRKTKPMQKTKFEKEVRRIDLSSFQFNKSGEGLYRGNYKMLNLSQLSYFIDSLNTNRDNEYVKFRKYVKDDFGFRGIYEDYISPDTNQIIDSTNIDSNYNQKTKGPAVSKNTAKNLAQNQILDKIKKKKNEKENQFEKRKKMVEIRRDFYDLPLDTTVPPKENFMANFNKRDREIILESALSSLRTSSYHNIIINDNLENKEKFIQKYKVEWHRKFTLSVACLILFFIGAPLGAIIRKGGLGMPIIASVIIFILYHVLSITGEKSAEEMAISPTIGMWLANMVFFPIGIFLTYKASTDSPIMDSEVYQKFFGKLLSKFKRN